LRNTQKHGHLIIAPQKTFDERKVANFRRFCIDFFDEANPPQDPLELARHGADKLKGKLDELKATVRSSKYPFVEQLEASINLLEQAVGKSDDWYLNDFDIGDDLLDSKESLIDPIQSFLNGAQRSIYDNASTLIASNSSNLAYLPRGVDEPVKSALDDPNAFRGNRMAQLKQAADDLSSAINEVVDTNRATVTASIESRKAELLSGSFYTNATSEAQERAVRKIDHTLSRISNESQIAIILQIGATFESSDFPALLDLLAASQQGADDSAPPPKQTVAIKTIAVPGASGVLESEEDIDKYLVALRDALVHTLNDGKRISL